MALPLLTGPTRGVPRFIANSTSAKVFLDTNAERRGATIFNGGSNTLYLLLAGQADGVVTNSTGAPAIYSLQVPANGYYEVPFGYRGPVQGVWDTGGTGSAFITELL